MSKTTTFKPTTTSQDSISSEIGGLVLDSQPLSPTAKTPKSKPFSRGKPTSAQLATGNLQSNDKPSSAIKPKIERIVKSTPSNKRGRVQASQSDSEEEGMPAGGDDVKAKETIGKKVYTDQELEGLSSEQLKALLLTQHLNQHTGKEGTLASYAKEVKPNSRGRKRRSVSFGGVQHHEPVVHSSVTDEEGHGQQSEQEKEMGAAGMVLDEPMATEEDEGLDFMLGGEGDWQDELLSVFNNIVKGGMEARNEEMILADEERSMIRREEHVKALAELNGEELAKMYRRYYDQIDHHIERASEEYAAAATPFFANIRQIRIEREAMRACLEEERQLVAKFEAEMRASLAKQEAIETKLTAQMAKKRVKWTKKYAEVTDPIAIQNHIEDAELQLMLKQQKQRNAGKGRGQSAEDKKAKKVKRS